MRHAIANLLYRLASRLDQPVRDNSAGLIHFGDQDRWPAYDESHPHTQTNVHLQPGAPISGSFTPGTSYGEYAALRIGAANETTIFLNRQSLHRLFAVLREFERLYREHGEGQPL